MCKMIEMQKVLLDNLELEHLKMDNEVRFILAVVNGEIIVSNRKRSDLFLELHQKGFTPFPKKTKGVEAAIAGALVEGEEDGEDSAEMIKGGVKASDYDYLLSMSIGTLTLEKVRELCGEKAKIENELVELRNTSPTGLWLKDLDALEKKLDELDAQDIEDEKLRNENRRNNAVGLAAAKQAPKKPRKNNVAKKNAADDGKTCCPLRRFSFFV